MFRRFFRPKRIYLDYAAATPVRDEVLAAMAPYFGVQFANPSAIHAEGVAARKAVEEARGDVARTLRVRAEDVIFTGSGTEANNLAIYGLLRAITETSNRSFSDCEIISTKLEHPSVLEVLKHLEGHGVTVKYAPVDEDGRIVLAELQKLLSPQTVLIAYAYANSEIGVVQDVKRISRMIKKHNDEHKTQIASHLDAAQAPLWLPCQMDMLGVDYITLDAGKCYGPKGVGILARRHGALLKGIVLGGGQESGLRAGTENTPLIVGAARAIDIAQSEWESRSVRVRTLRDSFLTNLQAAVPSAIVNGSTEHRIANNVNISIPGIDAEFAVITLDAKGIAASTKSACSGADSGGSTVVKEVSGDESRAASTLRLTFGEETTERDSDRVIAILREHVAKIKSFQQKLT